MKIRIWVLATMDNSVPLYDLVMACFRAKLIPQKIVAVESGVPFSTVAKIAQGAVKDPSVHTVQKLYDYFASKGVCSRRDLDAADIVGGDAQREQAA